MTGRTNRLLSVFSAGMLSAITVLAVPKVLEVTVPATVILVLASGYAVGWAVFADRQIGVPERLAVSLALSFAVLILGGLVLNLSARGLTHATWVALLIAVVAGGGFIGWLRSPEAPARIPRLRLRAPHAAGALLLGLAVATTCAAVVVARIVPRAHQSDGYSALWILPGHHPGQVRLGVISDELRRTQYRVELWLGSRRLLTRPLTLTTGQDWSTEMLLPHRAPRGTIVKARLYRASQPASIYRYAHLVVQ